MNVIKNRFSTEASGMQTKTNLDKQISGWECRMHCGLSWPRHTGPRQPWPRHTGPRQPFAALAEPYIFGGSVDFPRLRGIWIELVGLPFLLRW